MEATTKLEVVGDASGDIDEDRRGPRKHRRGTTKVGEISSWPGKDGERSRGPGEASSWPREGLGSLVGASVIGFEKRAKKEKRREDGGG